MTQLAWWRRACRGTQRYLLGFLTSKLVYPGTFIISTLVAVVFSAVNAFSEAEPEVTIHIRLATAAALLLAFTKILKDVLDMLQRYVEARLVSYYIVDGAHLSQAALPLP